MARACRPSRPDEWQQQLNDPHGFDREFVIVSHSLGSYLVFSTLDVGPLDAKRQNAPTQSRSSSGTEDDAAQYIFERTSLVYFFANQVPLLELANIRGRKAAGLAAEEEMAQGEATGTLSTQMTTWVHLRQNFEKRRGGEEKPAAGPQAIAWSDPSDLLSWRVPGVEGLALSNVHVRNTKWWWLIASPSAAHANYASNKNVLRMMLGPRASSAESQVGEYDLNHQESTLAVPSSGVWSR